MTEANVKQNFLLVVGIVFIIIGLSILASGQNNADKSLENLSSFTHNSDNFSRNIILNQAKKQIVQKQANSMMWGFVFIFLGIRILFSSFSKTKRDDYSD